MKKLMTLAAAVAGLASTAVAQPFPNNGQLGLYSDATASSPSCCLTAAPFALTTLHLVFTTAGETAGGITGAEFRIEVSNPAGYSFSFTADPAFGTAIGDPMDTTPADPNDAKGMNMASANCQPSDHTPVVGDKVHCGSLSVINLGGGATDFIIKRKSPPSNPIQADCPLVTLCDAPVFTKSCLTAQTPTLPNGVEGNHYVVHLNATNCNPSAPPCGFVGVEQKTWTGVKSLFR